MPKMLTKQLIGDSIVSFVDADLISSPFTQIINRASLRNPAADLRVQGGSDRFMVQQAVEITNEFGANGERVYKALGDDRDLVRFVGQWANIVDTNGTRALSSTQNDYIEVVFYGTGLNILTNLSTSTYDFRVTVDGGVEGSNIATSSFSNVVSGRNYSPNQVLTIVSGLAIGTHFVKIRIAGASNSFLNTYGFEIVNESASLRVAAGSYVKDQRRVTLESALSLAMKPAALSGVKGGRVVVYSSGSAIGQAVQAVDATIKLSTLADHSNEELTRTYYWREFGAARSDDFSISNVSSANLAYTLEDGATTLGGTIIGTLNDSARLAGDGAFLAFTFVGTGLDFLRIDGASGGADTYNFQVNGGATQSLVAAGSTKPTVVKIVSGLPYGTHTVKFNRVSASSYALGINRLMVYGPKKPAIPAGAVELADYNVVADYADNGATSTTDLDFAQKPTGVVHKSALREFAFVGTWSVSGNTNTPDQSAIVTSTNSDFFTYTFFGTGFVTEFATHTGGTCIWSLTIDGVANASGVNVVGVTNNGGGSYTNAGSPNFGPARVKFTGLTAGIHTIKVTKTGGAGDLRIVALDIIAPIHAPRSNSYADLQNSLPVGSCSLSDSRQILQSTSSLARAWSQAIGITSGPTTSATTYVPMADMSAVIKSQTGRIKVSFNVVNNPGGGGGNINIAIFVDGLQVGIDHTNSISGNLSTTSGSYEIPVGLGFHKVDLYWKISAGTATASGIARAMTVEDV